MTLFPDVFGKAASAIPTRILGNPSEKITDVSSFRTKEMEVTDEDVLATVDGERCAEQAEKLRIIRSRMDSLELCRLNLDSLILTIAEKYLPQINLLLTAPGIQSFSATAIISEIGVDMSVFPTSKHLCSWADLTPQNNKSAGKKKTARISRAGAYIKPLPVQCALARLLLTAIYHILKKNEPYHPELYLQVDRPPVLRELSVDEAVFILQRQGYLISAPPP